MLKRYVLMCVIIFIWLPKRDEYSDVLIGTCGIRRSDWPECVQTVDLVVIGVVFVVKI